MKTVTVNIHGRTITIEVGRMAKQANGAALIRCGETMVLTAATAARTPRENTDFLPLSVDYVEKFPAAGKIPGGFFKREGKLSDREVLVSRLTDRPLRPLFPDTYFHDTQVVSTVLSYDKENEPDVLSIVGASTALHISEIPFAGPIGAVRVGRINGQLTVNASLEAMKNSDIDMVVAASREAIVMVEGGANEVPESEILDALMFGFESIKPLLDAQDELRREIGKPKWKVVEETSESHPLAEKIRSMTAKPLSEALKIKEKLPRYKVVGEIKDKLVQDLCAADASLEDKASEIKEIFEGIVRSEIRNTIVQTQKRIDQRATNEIRSINVEVGLLPRTHGSALFTRGETQALVTTTLGTTDDEQRIDALVGESRSRFMLHYNFPSFSVGEVKPNRGPGRREVGHGALAHRAISKILPEHEKFPYTIRIVSEVLESHGSSSMATVCGAALSLMDAGVPIKAPVAGIAMGLVKEGEKFFILSDISGDEDHIGDMDFKVAGTEKGITAIQMDIKVLGVSREVLDHALAQAREGRLHILGKMREALLAPREELSKYAPRIVTIQIKQDKIRDLIGPGGKMIRSIVEQTQAKIDVEDSGKVTIASADLVALEKAKAMVEAIVGEAEIGRIYKGKVRRIMEYGAFVEIMPGTDGLVHISQLHAENGRVEAVEDVIKEGDEIEVKVISIDDRGKIKLSQREAIAPGSGNLEAESGRPPRRSYGDQDRRPGGPRGGERPRFGDRPRSDDRPRGPRRDRGDFRR
ncbi:MAG TPA: polyribonucleotide nucleotidyltransferase [Bdellovibrionota bacterium]|nr:polyribonucleotide nucleotidyltransferase [Bdellovibrionota bacterium]